MSMLLESLSRYLGWALGKIMFYYCKFKYKNKYTNILKVDFGLVGYVRDLWQIYVI